MPTGGNDAETWDDLIRELEPYHRKTLWIIAQRLQDLHRQGHRNGTLRVRIQGNEVNVYFEVNLGREYLS